jgi:hypothetical protein
MVPKLAAHVWNRTSHAEVLKAQQLKRLRLRAIEEAQDDLNLAWERLYMKESPEYGDEPDDGAILDYEMALSRLVEAKGKANL